MSSNPDEPMGVVTPTYFMLRAKLPFVFSSFSHEQICEMIFNTKRGYLNEDTLAGRSPREMMIEMLKKERDHSTECLRLLGVQD